MNKNNEPIVTDCKSIAWPLADGPGEPEQIEITMSREQWQAFCNAGLFAAADLGPGELLTVEFREQWEYDE